MQRIRIKTHFISYYTAYMLLIIFLGYFLYKTIETPFSVILAYTMLKLSKKFDEVEKDRDIWVELLLYLMLIASILISYITLAKYGKISWILYSTAVIIGVCTYIKFVIDSVEVEFEHKNVTIELTLIPFDIPAEKIGKLFKQTTPNSSGDTCGECEDKG